MTANKREELMLAIQTAGFQAIEATLYLDVYPDCREALEFFDAASGRYDALVEQYESEFGPLAAEGNMTDKWEWVDGPWPWKGV